MRPRPAWWLLLATLLAAAPRAAVAAGYAEVELGRFGALGPAVRLAKRASSKLHLPIDVESLKAPPGARIYSGAAVTVHAPAAGAFVVTSYLGLRDDAAAEALAAARRFAGGAKLVAVAVEEAALSPRYEATSLRQVLILGSYRDYAAAADGARRAAAAMGLPYSTRGMIFDKAHGLIWPATFGDSIYAGSYYGRRDDSCGDEGTESGCVSVERSEFYGFRPGLYVVIGGILGSGSGSGSGSGAEDLAPALARAKKAVPDAYLKEASIYLGCIH